VRRRRDRGFRETGKGNKGKRRWDLGEGLGRNKDRVQTLSTEWGDWVERTKHVGVVSGERGKRIDWRDRVETMTKDGHCLGMSRGSRWN
jgi:hypothetical protein